VTAHRFSLVAKEKIEAAGGLVIETTERKPKSERKHKRDRAAKSKVAAKAETEAPEEGAVEPSGGEGSSETEDEGNGSGG
jgi:hypothetical protein